MFRSPPRYLPLLLLGLLLSSTQLHAARLYKWVDDAGNVHYTEKPPRDINTEKVIEGNEPEVAPAAPVDNSPLVIPVPVDVEGSQRTAEKCQRLLDDLNLFSSEQDIIDDKGNTVVVSPEMRAAKAAEIQAELDQHCR